MILLNSFLHRHTLADIIGRWMVDRLLPTDVRTLKELVSYNGHIAHIVLDEVASNLFATLAGGPVVSLPIIRKGVLKDFLADHPPYTNPAIEGLIARYRKFPQDFFRETPFDGRLYFCGTEAAPQILGTTRRKRFKRVAEKSSRRIIDHVFQRIKDEATGLATDRARHLGIPIDRLNTPMEKQQEEFVHAERRIIKRIRSGVFLKDMPRLEINDVFGVKAFCEDADVARVTGQLRQHPRLELLEYELHSGSYNALNIALKYRIDRDALLARPPAGATLERLAARGLDAAAVSAGYQRFVRDAEDDLILEVIVTSFGEALESEIGRSMHEERVLAQRESLQYRGSLARNIVALLDYMLALRRTATDQLDEIPIKLWIKYMPDYFEMVMKSTYGVTETVYLA
jgi:hypothetical protein